MSNNQENVRSNNSAMSTVGQIIGRLATAAIVLAITAFLLLDLQ